MSNQIFDPFTDRLSRDLRNDLSTGLAQALDNGESGELVNIVDSYRQRALADCYGNYLEDRYTRYKKALSIIKDGGITDPIKRSLILWDLGLFFEVHEVLENAWYSATGSMKLTLQALIRAAGVYIKREYGYMDSARRIGEKAVPVLQENRALLAAYFDPDILITALRDQKSQPPTLQH
ncbi:MAG: DUF309 domain-containing protein [Desulforhopalus sp.]|nr:DUF309 domain-containing protein [Desulforhopalus sp.]